MNRLTARNISRPLWRHMRSARERGCAPSSFKSEVHSSLTFVRLARVRGRRDPQVESESVVNSTTPNVHRSFHSPGNRRIHSLSVGRSVGRQTTATPGTGLRKPFRIPRRLTSGLLLHMYHVDDFAVLASLTEAAEVRSLSRLDTVCSFLILLDQLPSGIEAQLPGLSAFQSRQPSRSRSAGSRAPSCDNRSRPGSSAKLSPLTREGKF